ncbi:hypothetical protein [Streptomyces sp. 2A115]|uniref:hypothetical protein n=1 Tax=Streptomyces sp. 2A115 TaxID=3457439 RepID=UPI003FD31E91
MPADTAATAPDLRPAQRSGGGAGACVRAGVFTLAGSVLAALGHSAVAGAVRVPWLWVTLLALLQFAAVWPAARRRFSLPSTLVCTLVSQGALHLALALAGGTFRAGTAAAPHHTMRGHSRMAAGDGHAWHDASGAMTTVHVLAALTVAWLLHRADAALAAAPLAARAVGGIAAAVAGWMRPWLTRVPLPRRPAVPLTGCFTLPTAAGARTLQHALVRRGPPGPAGIPLPLPAGLRLLPAWLHQQGFPLWLHIPLSAPHTGSLSPAPPR